MTASAAPARFDDFEVLSFDCYGTLIDWERGIVTALEPLLRGAGHRSAASLLETFGRIETEEQQATPSALYPAILARVHLRLAAELQAMSTEAMDEAFAASVAAWPPFPDTTAALHRMRERFRLVILSNVHRSGLEASLGQLGVAFDAVYTAEDIGCYKPHPATFRHLIDGVASDLSVTADSVLHTAQSLYHDHVPARAAGLATAWIDRRGLASGGGWGATTPVEDPPTPDFTFSSLAEMADAVVPAG